MSENDRDNNDQGAPKRRDHQLPHESVEDAKNAVLFGTSPGVGYKRPPEHGRFKKGQSGNPKGRPRTRDLGVVADSSADVLVLKEAERLITVREGAEVTQIRKIEAVLRSQYAEAIKGNAYAQKHTVEHYDRAERERRRTIADGNAVWEDYVARWRSKIVDAQHKNEDPPTPLPHPDDVIIDPDRGVRFIGPVDEEQAAQLEETCRVRDVLLTQDALDQRSTGDLDGDDPLDGPGTAFMFAIALNNTVPDRFKLGDTQIVIRTMRYERVPKRQLLKDVYQGWRSIGRHHPRGKTFPPLRVGQQWMAFLGELLKRQREQRVDLATCTPDEIDNVVTEVMQMRQREP